jgi:hypothetical protein
MSTPNVPRKYQGTRYTRERYIEGWQDAQAGKPHAHAGHADEIIRQQGQAQYDAYSEGHAAGRQPFQAEPELIVRANALLDELEHSTVAALHTDLLTELVARLRRVTERMEAYLDDQRTTVSRDDLDHLTDQPGE